MTLFDTPTPELQTMSLGTTLQPIPDGKEFIHEDHPEVVAAAVSELLARPPGDDREQ